MQKTDQLDQINKKLDLIMIELEEERRHRQAMNELKDDLTGIAKDVFATTVVELEDISPFIESGDFKHLVKKVLRNIKPITQTISQFESLRDFLTDVSPLNKELFSDLLFKLDEFDRKGYFRLVRELGSTIDNAVQDLSDEDVNRISENLASMIDLFKVSTEMNLPSIAANALKKMGELDVDKYEARSIWEISKEFNSKPVRRLLGLLLMFISSFSNEINYNNIKGVNNAN